MPGCRVQTASQEHSSTQCQTCAQPTDGGTPCHERGQRSVRLCASLSRHATLTRQGATPAAYVALLSFRPSVSGAGRDAALIRRAGWQYPAGDTLIAEYWPLAADLQVISILSSDDIAAIMEVIFQRNDVFDVAVHPAVSAEQGLQLGAEVFARLPRLQGG
jgi:hypothetical protein